MLTPFLVAEMAAAVLLAEQADVFLAQAALADLAVQQLSNCLQGHGPAVIGAFRS